MQPQSPPIPCQVTGVTYVCQNNADTVCDNCGKELCRAHNHGSDESYLRCTQCLLGSTKQRE